MGWIRCLLITACFLVLTACDSGTPPPAPTATPSAVPADVREWLQQQDRRQLDTLHQQARLLLINIQQLLAEPTDAHLEAARHSFLELYQHFHESRVALQCRNLQAPERRAVIARLDPLPILPGFVDALAQWPDSGLVNDDTLALSAELLLDEQNAGFAEETSLGLQVIGFLLEGDPQAPHTPAHFDPLQHRLEDNQSGPIERRRSYLLLAAQQWINDFASIRDTQANITTGRDCPLAALRLAVDQQLKLNALGGLDDVEDAYFPGHYRALALQGGHRGMAAYLGEENPWREWMTAQSPTHFNDALTQWQRLQENDTAETWQAFNGALNAL